MPILTSQIGKLHLSLEERWVDSFAGFSFSIVLFWWIVSPQGASSKPFYWRMVVPGRNWGIGNPTITMVISLVAAIIATFAFAHDLFK
jgi:hypothetical protein